MMPQKGDEFVVILGEDGKVAFEGWTRTESTPLEDVRRLADERGWSMPSVMGVADEHDVRRVIEGRCYRCDVALAICTHCEKGFCIECGHHQWIEDNVFKGCCTCHQVSMSVPLP